MARSLPPPPAALLAASRSSLAKPQPPPIPAVAVTPSPKPAADAEPDVSEGDAGDVRPALVISDVPVGLESCVVVEESVRPAARKRKRLGELLVEAGVIKDKDVERALAVQKMGGGRLGSILLNLRLCTEEQIRDALARQLGVEIVELAKFEPDERLLKLLPIELVRKYEVLPIKREDDDTLWVAMLDPYNLTALDDVRFATGCKRLVVVSCTEEEFNRFMEEHFATQSMIKEIMDGGEFYDKVLSSVIDGDVSALESDDDSLSELRIAGEQAPIITLCNFLLVESVQRRASDVHVEPYETYFRIRFRIDGRLHTLLTPPQRLHTPMIARIKVMASMDISQRRAPQDGHVTINYAGETVHYRVSTLPTVYGEKCVIRLLKKDDTLHQLDRIGFSPEELRTIQRGIRSPQGIILVTGPTGSGKTTTLHAGLNEINEPDVNIVTIEDPVEATIAGINHVQINELAGVSFATALRSILRQDPDVVFVGEMRDREVAAIAVKGALTGHLVLSTLHTNSAIESLLRLEDMELPPYLIANALIMIVAQRLVRTVCPVCSEPYAPTPAEIGEFQISDEQLMGASMRKGAGCEVCMNSGYRGRSAVYEILDINNEIRQLVRQQAPGEQIIRAASEAGMRFLYEVGIEAALKGKTTLDEVRRVLSDAR